MRQTKFFQVFFQTALCTLAGWLFFLPSAHAAAITGIAPTQLRPGTIVQLTGNGFGTAPFEGTQVCFSETLCTTSGNFSTFVRSWSDTAISVLVPYQDIPATGRMSVVLPTNSGGVLLQSPTYTYSKSDPVVSSTSTKVIVPGTTQVVLQGQNFLDFIPGKSTICINSSCLTDTQLGNNILAWSNSSITAKLPYLSGVNNFTLNVVVHDPLLENIPGASPQRIVEIPGFSYEIPPLPQITAIAPTDVYPGNTTIVLQGEGFGEKYTPGINQICFGDRCLSDMTDIPQLLKSWSPTRIELTAPLWLAVATTPVDQVSVRVYDVVEQRYGFISAPTRIVVRPVPVITEVVPVMEMGNMYLLRGKDLGNLQGSVSIAGVPLDVRSWSPTEVSFWVGDNVQSGALQVRSQDGKVSQQVPVTIQSRAIFSQDEFTRLMWYFGTLGIQEAWSQTRGSQDVVVAVVDSGIDFSHEDLQSTQWVNEREIPNNGKDDDGNGYIDDVQGWNFVTNAPAATPVNSHGTMVASVVAAQADNYVGLAGVAPGVRLMNLQVTTPADANSEEDYITLNAAQRAIKYAVDNGADIINLSFASDSDDAFYKDIISYAYARNVLVVIAAGNDGKDLNAHKYSPVCDDGALPYAIGVSSVSANNTVSDFANNGSSCVDIFAPGEKIVAGAPSSDGGKYMLAEGTSFAAPIVSGTAALIKSLHPEWNVAEIRKAILDNAQKQNGLSLLAIGKTLTAVKPQATFAPDTDATGSITDEDAIFTSDPIPVTPVQPDQTSDDPTSSPVVNLDPIKAPARTFSDIPSTSDYYIPVTELSRTGVIQGYEDGSYRPLTPVNRAEFLKILMEGSDIQPDPAVYRNCFPDVTTEWFAPYVCYAKELGVVEGYPGAVDADGRRLFMPARTINKVEALKVILEHNDVPLAQGKNSYNDVELGSWYYPYVTTAEKLSLLDERFTLNPGDSLSRGVMAQIIYRLGAWEALQNES